MNDNASVTTFVMARTAQGEERDDEEDVFRKDIVEAVSTMVKEDIDDMIDHVSWELSRDEYGLNQLTLFLMDTRRNAQNLLNAMNSCPSLMGIMKKRVMEMRNRRNG